jgi:hypothetical protein
MPEQRDAVKEFIPNYVLDKHMLAKGPPLRVISFRASRWLSCFPPAASSAAVNRSIATIRRSSLVLALSFGPHIPTVLHLGLGRTDMSALYAMSYVGQADIGAGVVYIGKGIVLGADAGGGRYKGTYTDQGGQMVLDVTLTMTVDNNLVTGDHVPAGTVIPMHATWPANFADGSPQTIMVAGKPVRVAFEKVGDIP